MNMIDQLKAELIKLVRDNSELKWDLQCSSDEVRLKRRGLEAISAEIAIKQDTEGIEISEEMAGIKETFKFDFKQKLYSILEGSQDPKNSKEGFYALLGELEGYVIGYLEAF